MPEQSHIPTAPRSDSSPPLLLLPSPSSPTAPDSCQILGSEPKARQKSRCWEKIQPARDGEDSQESLGRAGQALTQQQLAQGHPFVPTAVRVYFLISQDLSPWFEDKEKERARFPKSHRNGSCGLAGLGWECCESPAVSGRLLRERPLAWRAGNINELLMSPAFLSHPHPAQVWAGGCWQHLHHPKKS